MPFVEPEKFIPVISTENPLSVPDQFNPRLESPQEAPSIGSTIGAAFTQANTTFNIGAIASSAFEFIQPTNPDFNPLDQVVDTPYEPYLGSFMNANNDEQVNRIKGRIDKDLETRDVLSRSGWVGVPALLLAGALDPIMWILPAGLGAAAKGGSLLSNGVINAAKTSLVFGGAVAAQEFLLMEANYTKTYGEAAKGVATGMVLGGLLGGAASAIGRRGATLSVDKTTSAMDEIFKNIDIDRAIPGDTKFIRDFNNTRIEVEKAGLVNKLPGLTINQRLAASEFPTAQRIGFALPENGIRLNGELPGPAVETIVDSKHARDFTKLNKIFDEEFKDFLMSEGKDGLIKRIGSFKQVGSLSEVFKEAVITAATQGDVSNIPQAAAVAKKWRPIVNQIAQELIDQDIIPLRSVAVREVQTKVDEAVKRLESFDKTVIPNVLKSAQEKLKIDKLEETSLLNLSKSKTSERVNLETSFNAKSKKLEELSLLKANEIKSSRTVKLNAAVKKLEGLKKSTEKETEKVISKLDSEFVKIEAASNKEIAALEAELVNLKAKSKELKRAAKNDNKPLQKRISKAFTEIEDLEESVKGTAAERRLKINKRKSLIKELEKRIDARIDKSLNADKKFNLLKKSREEKLSKINAKFKKLKAAKDKKSTELFDKIQSRTGIVKAEEDVAKLAKSLEDAADLANKLKTGAPLPKGIRVSNQAVALKNDINNILNRLEKIDGSFKAKELKVRSEFNSRRLKIGDETSKIKKVQEDLSGKIKEARQELKDVEAIRFTVKDLDLQGTAKSWFHRMFNKQLMRNEPKEFELAVGTWFSNAHNLTLEQGIEIAEDIFNTIINKNEGIVGNTFGISKGTFKGRTFLIPDDVLRPWLINDPLLVLDNWVKTAWSQIELKKRFGSLDLKDEIAQIRAEAKAIETANPSIASKTRRNAEGRIKDINVLLLRLQGLQGVQFEQGAFYSTMRSIRNFNNAVLMGGLALNTFTDIGQMVLQNGFVETFGGLTELFLLKVLNPKAYREVVEDMESIGIGVTAYVNNGKSLYDIGSGAPIGLRVERITSGMADFTFKASMVSNVDGFTKRVAAYVSAKRIFRNVSKGPGGISAKELSWMRNLGIKDTDYSRLASQIKRHSRVVDRLTIFSPEKWTDDNAREVFAAALKKVENVSIITPGIGDAPIIFDNPAFQLLFQYKRFAMAAMQRSLIPSLQRADAGVAAGLAVMFTGGMLGEVVRTTLRGDDPRELDVETIIARAVKRLDMGGFAIDAYGMASRFLGDKPYNGSAADELFGSAAGFLNRSSVAAQGVLRAVQGKRLTKQQVRAFRLSVPMQSIVGVNFILTQGEKSINNKLGNK